MMDLNSCSIVAPSLRVWSRSVAVHGGLTVLLGVPLGAVLYVLPRRTLRAPVALLAGVAVASAVPIGLSVLRRHLPPHEAEDPSWWMTAFLASTFGFHIFFKSAATALGTFPEGADADMPTWLGWYCSLPEPVIAKGGVRRAPPGEVARRVRLLLGKTAGCSASLTLLLNSPCRGAPFGDGGGLLTRLLNGYVQLWFLYFWTSFCLDSSALSLTLGSGAASEDGHRNPLLASRTVREVWGERWDLPVRAFLKRAFYVPARRAGVPPTAATLLTFLGSGLLHEYNFSIHNSKSYDPGRATSFFLLMGALMITEDWVLSKHQRRSMGKNNHKDWAEFLPTPIISTCLVLIATAPFEALFMRSWIESGVLEAVAGMIPHVICQR